MITILVRAAKGRGDKEKDPSTGRKIPEDRDIEVRASREVFKMIHEGRLIRTPVGKPKKSGRSKAKPEG